MQIFLVQELIGLLLEGNTKAAIYILHCCIGRSRLGLFLLSLEVVRNLLNSVFVCQTSNPSLDIYNKRIFEKIFLWRLPLSRFRVKTLRVNSKLYKTIAPTTHE